MKQKIASVIGMIVVVILVVVCVKYFRYGSSIDMEGFSIASGGKEVVYQEGEPDQASEELAEEIGKEAKYIVSTGKVIRGVDYAYQVDSWEITKEDFGYSLPEGITSLEELYGVIRDGNGTIQNEYSFLIVNVTIENLTDTELTDYIWGEIKLKVPRVCSPEYFCLGEENPRPHRKSYGRETIPAKGKVTKALLYVLEDQWVEQINDGAQPYLEISFGDIPSVKKGTNVRWIVLN